MRTLLCANELDRVSTIGVSYSLLEDTAMILTSGTRTGRAPCKTIVVRDPQARTRTSRKRHLTITTAENFGVQEFRIGDLNVSWIRRCCRYSSGAEDVSVTDVKFFCGLARC